MTEYKQGQQDLIDRIKQGVKPILKESKKMDVMLDIVNLLTSLEAQDKPIDNKCVRGDKMSGINGFYVPKKLKYERNRISTSTINRNNRY